MDDIEFPVNLPDGCTFDYSIKDSYYENDYGVLNDKDLHGLFDDYDSDDDYEE
tara:strand:- start:16076 stop:16234 length:159 start_codon:yes stop_codon:yes gene_type:complete